METRNVRGVPVEIHTAGSGPPLLYLHAEQYFEQVRPYLDALAKKWTVIAPRHPGYGAASKTADLRSVDDLAYLYLDLLDELKLDKVILVGASFGGWVALEMCVRNHARLSKLVLISSVGVKFSGREERDFADLFYMTDVEAFPKLFADPKRHAPNYAAMSAGQLEEIARERQMLAHYGWRPYLHNPALKRWLHRVDLPTLVVWGAGGQVCQTVLRAVARRGPAQGRADAHPRGGTLSRDRAERCYDPRHRRLRAQVKERSR